MAELGGPGFRVAGRRLEVTAKSHALDVKD